MPPSCPHERPFRGWRDAALALALGLTAESAQAACASAQPPSPFPVVEVEAPPPRSHVWSYVAIGSGVALVGSSFLITARANDTYDSYLRETEPSRIETLYDRAVFYDRLSSTALIGGELLIVGGLYVRFLRSAPPSRLSLAIGPRRCALALRF